MESGLVPKLLNLRETASALRISVSGVRRLLDRGCLPRVRFGARVLVPAEAVRRLVTDCTTPAEDQ